MKKDDIGWSVFFRFRLWSLAFWMLIKRCPVCHYKLHRSYDLRWADPDIYECLMCKCGSDANDPLAGRYVASAKRHFAAVIEMIKENRKKRNGVTI